MKSIINYIKESLNLNEGIEDFWKKTRETVELQDSLQRFTKSMNGKKLSFENQSQLTSAYNKFLSYITIPNKSQVLKKYGLENMNKFKEFIFANKEKLENDKRFDTAWVKDFDLTELQKEYKKAKAEGTIQTGEKKKEDEVEDRALVIYHRYDPSNYLVYPFKGKRNADNRPYSRLCRMDFQYETGIDYWETYDCLANYFFSHSPEELKELHKKEDDYEEDPNEFK